MNQNSNSTFHVLSTPIAPSATIHGQAAAREPAGASASADLESSAGSGGSARGRKSGYSERIIEMMCGPIREHGLSDSAAAEGVGMSSSTISRWKQQYPELGPQLQQAREQARLHHLRLINQAAEAENGKGWRASAWMLERLFPGDYSPRMQERALWREFEEYRRECEENQFRMEEIEERVRQHNERVAQEKQAAAAAQAEAAKCEAASEPQVPSFVEGGASQNSRNGAAADPEQKALSAVEGSQAQRTVEGQSAPAEHPTSTLVTPSQNSRNSAEVGPHQQAEGKAPSAVERSQTLPEVLSSVEGSPVEEPAAPEPSASASESLSHNSRNSVEAPEVSIADALCNASVTVSQISRNSAPCPTPSARIAPIAPNS